MAVPVRMGVPGGAGRVIGRCRPQRLGRIRALMGQDRPAVVGEFGVFLLDLLPLFQRVLPAQDRLPVAAVRLLP